MERPLFPPQIHQKNISKLSKISQKNFWMLAEDTRHPEKQIIVFKNSELLWGSLNVEKLFIFNLNVLSTVLYRRRSFETTVKIRLKTRSRRLKSKS